MKKTPSTTEVELLARLLHESGRSPVNAGETLAATEDAPRPFVQWNDLPRRAREGRRLTARRLLEQWHVGHAEIGATVLTVEMVAREIHAAERAAIEAELVLTPLKLPWIPFDDLPDPAKRGRRRQAAYLLKTQDLDLFGWSH